MKTDTDVQLDEAGKNGTRIYRFSGDWRSASVHTITPRLGELAARGAESAEVDLERHHGDGYGRGLGHPSVHV